MIRDYATYIEYFRQLSELHPDIKSFIAGPSERLTSLERNTVDWPLMHITEPGIQPSDDRTTFTGMFLVVHFAEKDDWSKISRMMNRMQHIALELQAKLMEDEINGLFDLQFTSPLDPISGITHAHDVGWMLEFQLTIPYSICLPANSALNQDIFIPFFTYEISDGTLSLDHNAPAGFTLTAYNHENTELSSAIDTGNISLTGFPDYFWITFQLDSGEIASAWINQAVPRGVSVPYLISNP